MRTTQGEAAAALARRLSAMREELGDPEGAERALAMGFEANPRDSALRDLLVVRFSDRLDFARVAELLSRALRDQPNERELLERLMEAHRAAQNPRAALSVIEDLLRVDPHSVELQRKRATVLGDLGRDDEAVLALEQAYAADPSVVAELIEAIERAIVRADPHEGARLSLRLVTVLEGSGDLPGARSRLAAFVRGNPDDLSALRRLASLEGAHRQHRGRARHAFALGRRRARRVAD